MTGWCAMRTGICRCRRRGVGRPRPRRRWWCASGKTARAIVRARPLRSTLHLADVVERAVPRTGRLHPATKTFMALRMAVNDEPKELDRLLEIGPELLKSGGRMVVISFMSSDDRAVKEKFKALGNSGRVKILTKHPLQPTEEESASNPASRSAKLRALEMI